MSRQYSVPSSPESMTRRIGPVLAWGAIVAAGLLLLSIATFLVAERLAISRMSAAGKIADTTAGPVEYAEFGHGPAIVFVHGTPGGFDQFLTLAERVSDAGFRTVVFSRPGYLRTPLASGRTFAEQATLMDALRQHLGIESLTVVGLSGGGPVALRYAANHPERTDALILVAAVSGMPTPTAPAASQPSPRRRSADLMYLLGYYFPDRFVTRLGTWETASSAICVDESTRIRLARDLFGSLGFGSRRHAGYDNDIEQIDRADTGPAIESVTAPTLLLYAANDRSVPLVHGESIRDRLQGPSRFDVIDDARHTLFVTHAGRLLATLTDFSRAASRGKLQPTEQPRVAVCRN